MIVCSSFKCLIVYYMSVCRSKCVPSSFHIVTIESEDHTLPQTVIHYLNVYFTKKIKKGKGFILQHKVGFLIHEPVVKGLQ